MTLYSPFGDIPECNKWLPWAKSMLARQVPPINVYRPVENVEVMCNKIEDRIMITAGGLAVVTYLSQFSDDLSAVVTPDPLPTTPTGWEYWKWKAKRVWHVNFDGQKRGNSIPFAVGESKEFITNFPSDIRLRNYTWISTDRRITLHYGDYLRPDGKVGHDLMLNNVIYRTQLATTTSLNVLAIAYSGKGLCRIITWGFGPVGGPLDRTIILTHRRFNLVGREAVASGPYTTYTNAGTQFVKDIYARFLGDGNTLIVWHRQWNAASARDVRVRRIVYPDNDHIADPDITTEIYYRSYAFGELDDGAQGYFSTVLTYHNDIYFSMQYFDQITTFRYRCELYKIVGDSIVLAGDNSTGIGDVIHEIPPFNFYAGMDRYLFANVVEGIFVYAYSDKFTDGLPFHIYIKYKGNVIKAEDVPITIRPGEEAPISDSGNAKEFTQDAYDGNTYVLAFNTSTLIIGMKAKSNGDPNILRLGYRVDRLTSGDPSTGSLGFLSVGIPR